MGSKNSQQLAGLSEESAPSTTCPHPERQLSAPPVLRAQPSQIQNFQPTVGKLQRAASFGDINQSRARQATPAGELRRSKRIQASKVTERKSVAPELQRKEKSVAPEIPKRDKSAVPEAKKKQESAAPALPKKKQKDILPETQKKQQVAATQANEQPKLPTGYFTSDVLDQSAGNNIAGGNTTQSGEPFSSGAAESANINNHVLPTIESRESSPARSVRNGKGKGKEPMNNRSQSPRQSSNDRYRVSKSRSPESGSSFDLTRIQANLSESMEKMKKAQHDMAERIKEGAVKLKDSHTYSNRLEKELQKAKNELEDMTNERDERERDYLEYRMRELHRRYEITDLKAEKEKLIEQRKEKDGAIALAIWKHDVEVGKLKHTIKELGAALAAEQRKPDIKKWVMTTSATSSTSASSASSGSSDWLTTTEGSSSDTNLRAFSTWSSQAPDEQPSAELKDFAEYVKQKDSTRSFDHYRRGRAINGFYFQETLREEQIRERRVGMRAMSETGDWSKRLEE
ncbi:hypothetical protein M7I_4880 [Glarea lozoyensis 74030]|uniref:Uncharacterized protein n=1 Tax=Glarea lozoyensis (strain ATCC 74030 / MF5533) TaxID=1104152 RepID=H0EQD2_GLAL7|nr:hypothetical protein M7I_4880 [Glarea lozoyensis 74030]